MNRVQINSKEKEMIAEYAIQFIGSDSHADSFYINKAFFSCTGLIPEEETFENAAFNGYAKRFAAQRADTSKFGKKALNRVLKIKQINTLITDKPLNKEYLASFTNNKVEVIIAGKENQ